LTYASGKGHALVDRELYLPRGWTTNAERLQAAGVPGHVQFATKPALATAMICRALDAGTPAGWVAGDEVYGANPQLRTALEARRIGYVLAVACHHPVAAGGRGRRADGLAARVPRRAWQQISAGSGAKGHRYYDWAFIRLDDDGAAAAGGQAGTRWLMVRRHQRSGELAYYRCYTPYLTPLARLVRVAGTRWAVEETFQTGKGLAGLDQHQVRRWNSWYRWVTLAMLAAAFLAVAAVAERARHPTPPGLVAITCNELQHLVAALPAPSTPPTGHLGHLLRWSVWRRRHQARARSCHYRRQAAQR
jgi:SRSO17 transposase